MASYLENPYASCPGKHVWLRGNLHSHSTRSDGKREPQGVIDAFVAKGYHFFALSDHDVFSDYHQIDSRGMVLLTGNEITMSGPHILQIGATHHVPPHGNRQKVIDEISQNGGIAILNHPSWAVKFDHFSMETLLLLKGYDGIEIFNGHGVDCEGSAYALDKWDRLLSQGKLIWGFSNDDTHHEKDDGRGWNMVKVPAGDITAKSILEAMRKGCFYPSTGASFSEIDVDGMTLKIKGADGVDALEVIADNGRRVAFVESNHLEWDAGKTPCTYVRVQAYGRAGRMAWTQPFLIRGEQSDRLRKLEQVHSALDAKRPVIAVNQKEGDPLKQCDWDDSFWKDVPSQKLGYVISTGKTPDVATEFKIARNSTHLFFLMRAEEPHPEKMVLSTHRLGGPNIWRLETMQIYLDTAASQENYYQLLIAADGQCHASHKQPWADRMDWEVKPWKWAKGWGVLAAIKSETLNPADCLQKGAEWGFQISRNRPSADEHHVWTWVGPSNHTPARFGTLIFDPA